MKIFGLFLKGCKNVGRALFGFSKGAKAASKAKLKTPIPVGKPAVAAEPAKPQGFFARLAELNENKAYQKYKETLNQGLPFDHYMYMH